ncbi:hypothetical protein H2248_002724 [Termitomyces sp. 'cryptogamus']|nr:hypothetical protein H2248_002724 [Termitomyces sp. 'cryptogamus']
MTLAVLNSPTSTSTLHGHMTTTYRLCPCSCATPSGSSSICDSQSASTPPLINHLLIPTTYYHPLSSIRRQGDEEPKALFNQSTSSIASALAPSTLPKLEPRTNQSHTSRHTPFSSSPDHTHLSASTRRPTVRILSRQAHPTTFQYPHIRVAQSNDGVPLQDIIVPKPSWIIRRTEPIRGLRER